MQTNLFFCLNKERYLATKFLQNELKKFPFHQHWLKRSVKNWSKSLKFENFLHFQETQHCAYVCFLLPVIRIFPFLCVGPPWWTIHRAFGWKVSHGSHFDLDFQNLCYLGQGTIHTRPLCRAVIIYLKINLTKNCFIPWWFKKIWFWMNAIKKW
jgi:hypothetical protein